MIEEKKVRETKKSLKIKKQIDRGFAIAEKWNSEDNE